MTKEQFVKGCLQDYIITKIQNVPRKGKAMEELSKNMMPMPNVEFIVGLYPEYRALILKADAKEASLWMFLDVNAFTEEAVKKTADSFYDLINELSGGKME